MSETIDSTGQPLGDVTVTIRSDIRWGITLPDGSTAEAGDTVTLPAGQAAHLIHCGQAVATDAKPAKAPKVPAPKKPGSRDPKVPETR